jgi:hypothetical protein
LRINIHLAVLNKNDAPLGARFVANSSGRLAIMAESPARAVKNLLQDARAERTDFPRKWTRLERVPKSQNRYGIPESAEL